MRCCDRCNVMRASRQCMCTQAAGADLRILVLISLLCRIWDSSRCARHASSHMYGLEPGDMSGISSNRCPKTRPQATSVITRDPHRCPTSVVLFAPLQHPTASFQSLPTSQATHSSSPCCPARGEPSFRFARGSHADSPRAMRIRVRIRVRGRHTTGRPVRHLAREAARVRRAGRLWRFRDEAVFGGGNS